jgi:hypothetical protein
VTESPGAPSGAGRSSSSDSRDAPAEARIADRHPSTLCRNRARADSRTNAAREVRVSRAKARGWSSRRSPTARAARSRVRGPRQRPQIPSTASSARRRLRPRVRRGAGVAARSRVQPLTVTRRWPPAFTWRTARRGLERAGDSNTHVLDHPALTDAVDQLARLERASGRWALARQLTPFSALGGTRWGFERPSEVADGGPEPSSGFSIHARQRRRPHHPARQFSSRDCGRTGPCVGVSDGILLDRLPSGRR